MPRITIDGVECEFRPGEMIIQVANAHGIEIPQYCYHDGLSIVASCRICLAEVWAPNPRAENRLEPIPKLMPTCQTAAMDGQVVYTQSPKSVANQKAVMEYLLINHPLDCPVCDQAGECLLQDYSYEHGRGASRFEEQKIKQPKKDVGPNILLYSDRCIMCSRCVRFTREVSGTAELMVEGRGAHEQIDVFPGKPLDNPLAGNVVDLCPVGALLDKDFLFAKRVWNLTSTPSIDGATSSGDNIFVEHAEGRVHRVKPRANLEINKWWITDEVRYSYKHVHDEARLRGCVRRQHGAPIRTDYARAVVEAASGLKAAGGKGGGRLAVLVSPMLSCEEAYVLAKMAMKIDGEAVLGVGPVPVDGKDVVYPPGADEKHPGRFVLRAEKAPNARGVRRVLEALASGDVPEFDEWTKAAERAGAVVVTGNYPSAWVTPELTKAVARDGVFLVVMDLFASALTERAGVVIPGATWAEKAGCFENCTGVIQAFEQAIEPLEGTHPQGQAAMDIIGALHGERAGVFNAAMVRSEMSAASPALKVFATDVRTPSVGEKVEGDMAVVEL